MLNEKEIKKNVSDENVELSDAERQPCEIWTRVMGYHRSVESFNKGKKSEFAERVCFDDVSDPKQQSSDECTQCDEGLKINCA